MKRVIPYVLLLAAAGLAAGALPRKLDPAVVQVIRGARSDGQRAEKLLAAGRDEADEAKAVVLLDSAVEHGLRGARASRAVEAADEALDLLIEKAPDREALWQAKRLGLAKAKFRYAPRASKADAAHELLDRILPHAEALEADQKWAEAGEAWREAHSAAFFLKSGMRDLIAYRRQRAGHCLRLSLQVQRDSKKLTNGPSGAAGRERLIETLVIALGDLAAAQKLLSPDVAQTWRTYIPLAAGGTDKLAEAAALELGRWYCDVLLPKAGNYASLRILLAARSAFQRAATLHTAKDAAAASIARRIASIDDELEKLALEPNAGGRAGEIDLFRGTTLEHLDQKGIWDSSARVLTVWPRPDGYLRLPARIDGSYRVSLKFILRSRVPIPDRLRGLKDMRLSDKRRKWLQRKLDMRSGAVVAFPVGEQHVAVTVVPDRGKTTVKLQMIEPKGGFASSLVGEKDAADPNAAAAADERMLQASTVAAEADAIGSERVHQLDLVVLVQHGVATILVDVNRKRALRWSGSAGRCALDDVWPADIREGQILLGGWMGPTSFSAAKVCNFTGRTRLARTDKIE